MIKNFKGRTYFNPKGCGPFALRQLTDAPDHAVLSACILHGYDPVAGGITPTQFYDAAQTLGIKLSKELLKPCSPISVADVAALTKEDGDTVVVGLKNHVFVIRDGEVLDNVAQPWDEVDVVWPVG